MALSLKCGAEFLPSPLASKAEFALTTKPSLVRKGHMTAVAVTVEMGHAVAFVGTATGEVKADVYMKYSSMSIIKTILILVPLKDCEKLKLIFIYIYILSWKRKIVF